MPIVEVLMFNLSNVCDVLQLKSAHVNVLWLALQISSSSRDIVPKKKAK